MQKLRIEYMYVGDLTPYKITTLREKIVIQRSRLQIKGKAWRVYLFQ